MSRLRYVLYVSLLALYGCPHEIGIIRIVGRGWRYLGLGCVCASAADTMDGRSGAKSLHERANPHIPLLH